MDQSNCYTLQNISEWAEDKTVLLPTVQRGFVWKPSQIENLWDSLLRGYPVGAFVLSPNENRRCFDLLDGQQRATAICLGFGKETFRDSQDQIRVFIDLEQPREEDNRKFVFRVITKSHPWGYQRIDNTKTLTSENIRKAMNMYEIEDHLAEDSLDKFFPYDASLPVPFHLFTNAVLEDENTEIFAEKIIELLNQRGVKIDKIQVEKQAKPQSRKDSALSSEELSKRIHEILKSTKEILDNLTGQKIPALYLDFDKFKKTLMSSTSQETIQEDFNGVPNNEETHEDYDNSGDEIENLFIRLNAGGTPLRGEELNYSILKAKISAELQENIEKSCEGLFKPSRFITIAYRLFQHQEKEQSRDALTMRVKPKQFQREITNNLSKFKSFLTNVLDNKSYNNKTLINYSMQLLEYDENHNAYGLPHLIVSKLAEVAPEVMFILLYRLLHKEDKLEFKSDLHKRMIGIITLFVWLGKGEKQRDHAKLLSNVWPCVKTLRKELFWSSSTVQRALLNETLIHFPSYNGKCGLIQLGGVPGRKNMDIHAKFQEVTKCDRFLDIMLFNKDLILYAQREFLHKHFDKKQYYLDDTNLPFDWDHISPAKLIYRIHNIPKSIKYIYHSNGNFRAWPYSLNRMDQDDTPAIKLDPLNQTLYEDAENGCFDAIQNRWKNYFAKKGIRNQTAHHLKNQLVRDSFCSEKWANCVVKDMKKDWKAVYELIRDRNLSIFKEWYQQLNIEKLIPSENVNFNSVIDNRKWKWNKPEEWSKDFFSEDCDYWVSKPIPLEKTTVYMYFTCISTEENPEAALEDNGIEFGIHEKPLGDFIRNIKISDSEKIGYQTDEENYIQNTFTLISFDKESYVELFQNFKLWLERFPNDDVKMLADTLIAATSNEMKVLLKKCL